jgi:hypothetical protein
VRRPIASSRRWPINKEIDLRFVVAYTPLEFRDTLHMLAEGEVDPRPLITGEVGLAGVEAGVLRAGRRRAPRQDPHRPRQHRDRARAAPARLSATRARVAPLQPA